MIKLFRNKKAYNYPCRLSIISWQEFVDNYRTFAADIECDIERIQQLLDNYKEPNNTKFG